MKVVLVSAIGFLSLIVGQLNAYADVTIEPGVVEVKKQQLFSLQVVSERDQPTNKVKIYIPQGITEVRTFAKDRWNNVLDTDESGNITSIEWQGPSFIPSGQGQEFQFLAKIPDGEGVIEWEVEQTYIDNVIISYGSDLDGEEVESRDPISTQVVGTSQSLDSPEDRRSSIIGWLALAASVVALLLAFRAGSKAQREVAEVVQKEVVEPKKTTKKVTKKAPKSKSTTAKSRKKTTATSKAKSTKK